MTQHTVTHGKKGFSVDFGGENTLEFTCLGSGTLPINNQTISSLGLIKEYPGYGLENVFQKKWKKKRHSLSPFKMSRHISEASFTSQEITSNYNSQHHDPADQHGVCERKRWNEVPVISWKCHDIRPPVGKACCDNMYIFLIHPFRR